MVEAIKYFVMNAEKHHVDASKIAIGGSSGGGNICLAALILMARENMTHLCKAAFLWCPMMNNTLLDTPKEQCPEWQQGCWGLGSRFFNIMSTDFENQ